ncbi:Nucleic acid binding protein [Hibiscus syriacus]|uniref:Nucleic acid binding protein n=1 Tax=Hibiscus syriacus TaxID=106335 RepID=A0A6A3CUP1_HIBSY|nr:Nucleic acid binding protein [Hibiscus syriacus]
MGNSYRVETSVGQWLRTRCDTICLNATKLVEAMDGVAVFSALLRAIHGLRSKAWDTDIQWIPRECNKVVDALTRVADHYSLNVILFYAAPPDLLALLDREDTLPVARRLAEKVLENCALKLKPYLTQAVESLSISFDDYSSVVASICEVAPSSLDQKDIAAEKCGDDVNKPVESPLDGTTQALSTEQVDLANENYPKSVVSNGTVQTAEDSLLTDSNTIKNQEDDHLSDKSKNADTSTVAGAARLEAEKMVNSDSRSEESTLETGKKSDSKSTEPSDYVNVNEKEAETSLDPKKDCKDDGGSMCDDMSVDGDVSSENKQETDAQPSSPKSTEDCTNVASATPSGTIPDENHSGKAAKPERKEGSSEETMPSVDDVPKVSEGMSDSEVKTDRQSRKKVATVASNKVNDAVDLEDKKRRALGKVIPEKDGTKTSTMNDNEEVVASPKSVKPNKHDSHMEENPKFKEKAYPKQRKSNFLACLGIYLILELWFNLFLPLWMLFFCRFYEGVVHSFDAAKKKHKVHCDDGDTEILNLKREKWKVANTSLEQEEAANHSSPDCSSEMPQKKKAKTDDQSSKKTKMDGGGTSVGKSKIATTKSGHKTKEDSKEDSKSKDVPRSVSKSDNNSVTKSKDHTTKSGSKSVDAAYKIGNKSNNEDSGETSKSTKSKHDGSVTPKASTKSKQDTSKASKSKQETPKISSNSKGKPLKSGGKSNSNCTGKLKSCSSEVEESESMKENSTDSEKVVESAKQKSESSTKAHASDAIYGRKRRR